jgi:hypothetical protein
MSTYPDISKRPFLEDGPYCVIRGVDIDEHNLTAWRQAGGALVKFPQQVLHEAQLPPPRDQNGLRGAVHCQILLRGNRTGQGEQNRGSSRGEYDTPAAEVSTAWCLAKLKKSPR